MDTSFSIGDLVVYKNNQLIAFNKPAGLAVQPDNTGSKSLLDLARIYTQGSVYLIHRIDRPVSGVVLFAKTEGALAHLNQQFQERTIEKTYLALVKRPAPKDADHLIHQVAQLSNGNKMIIVEEGTPASQLAEMEYSLLESGQNLDLLKIKPITGRHHQIRVQLAAIGIPIRGDNKYGYKRGNKDRSIQLHAWKLSFQHPISGEREHISAAPPSNGIWDAFSSWKK